MLKLLATGDLHLGRTSTRVREAPAVHRAAEAWRRIVDLAIEEGCCALCLSGDVVDEANRFWEAIGPLEEGLGRLGEAGIRTLAVAGNHDYAVLGRLADQFDPARFTLLGRDGTWERVTLETAEGHRLHVDGWSFPAEKVHESPLADYALESGGAVPVLGMVHGDLDQSDSPYAPLDAEALGRLPPAAWLLGHVHKPRCIERPAGWMLYPGSPQALDPGEPGAHGPWLLALEGGRPVAPRQRPLSSVWYEHREVDLSGAVDEVEVEGRVLEALREAGAEAHRAGGAALREVLVRLRLTGRAPAAHRVPAVIERLVSDLELSVAGKVKLRVDAAESRVLPEIDLAQHAGSQAAPGLLARLLEAMEAGERREGGTEVLEAAETPETPETPETLVRRAREVLDRVARDRVYAALEAPEVDAEAARAHLEAAARALLAELLAEAPA